MRVDTIVANGRIVSPSGVVDAAIAVKDGRVVAIAERAVDEAPKALKPVWRFSLDQARARFDIISRFGRFPHRNPVLGRASTPQELTYLAKDDFIHTRSLPTSASSAISAIG